MRRFKEFLKEEPVDVSINTDAVLIKSNLDKANEDLEAITAITFVNSMLFVNAVRGTMERYGVLLPAEVNMQQLSMEGEYVYALGTSGLFVYMVHNLNPEGNVEGYAQVVSEEDLDDLLDLNGDEEEDSDVDELNPNGPSEWKKYPPARRDDDSGNDNEYT